MKVREINDLYQYALDKEKKALKADVFKKERREKAIAIVQNQRSFLELFQAFKQELKQKVWKFKWQVLYSTITVESVSISYNLYSTKRWQHVCVYYKDQPIWSWGLESRKVEPFTIKINKLPYKSPAFQYMEADALKRKTK